MFVRGGDLEKLILKTETLYFKMDTLSLKGLNEELDIKLFMSERLLNYI